MIKFDQIRLCVGLCIVLFAFFIYKTHLPFMFRMPLLMLLTFMVCFICIEMCLYKINPNKNLHEWTHEHLYGIKFDDRFFPPKKNTQNYWMTVQKGYDLMRQTKLVIGGLCKDNAAGLPVLFQRIEAFFAYFQQVQIVVFENDSRDNTRTLLKDWATKHPDKVHIIDCPNECKLNITDAKSTGLFSAERMNKMARFRNELLKYIEVHLDTFDYCCMMDMDLKGPISLDGIAHSFGAQDDLQWDSISSYGLAGMVMSFNRLVYYDGLAYKPLDDNVPSISPMLTSFQNVILASFQSRGTQPWLVSSGFGGMALYKMSSIKGIYYDDENLSSTCEHIVFHERMANAGFNKHYVNPNMILLAGLQGAGQQITH